MKLRPALRAIAPLASLATVGMVLAGCGDSSPSSGAGGSASPSASSSPSSTATPAALSCSDIHSGATSDSVKVSGAFGKAQKADIPSGLKATDTERTILTKGDGATATKGEQVDTLVSVYLGSGKQLGSQPLVVTVGDANLPELFTGGASCLPLGTRSVATAPAKDVYGPSGNPQAGIAPTDSIVVVSDLISIKKQVKPAAWTKNQAKVTFDSKGKPTVKLPKTPPPSQLELQVLKKGTGDTVQAGDSVTLDYQGTSWKTGKIFDQSYGKQPATFKTTDVVEGFGAALVGQRVGTRLIVSIPPKYAYGPKGSGQQLSGQTLVFVIDIKAVQHS
ncbi:MAG: FKBP-type peptidyl-prolyl cis-trans isomerase [Marmoricola sp.]